MKNVLYTGAFRFPAGDAAASRVFSIAQLFKEIDFIVDFAGWEAASGSSSHYKYNGHDCYSMQEFRETELNALLRLIGFLLRGYRTLKWLWKNTNYDIVIAYNPTVFFALGLLIIGKIRKFKVVLDNTEWYESEHLPGGKFGIASFENWLRMRIVYPRFRHVICISKFLENYYSDRNVINIPPLLLDHVDQTNESPPPAQGIWFLYAGNAGKKDRLLPFLAALPAIEKRLRRPVFLQIAGLDWNSLAKQALTHGYNPEAFKSITKCHGQISKEKVAKLYRESHFSILFRENKRYAQAGFPTKAVESWSMGCPIIMNPVGDISTIASDMQDVVFIKSDCIESELSNSLATIIDGQKLSQMSDNCLEKANKLFSMDAHKSNFRKFVQSIVL